MDKKVVLVLENGMTFDGYSFGYESSATGEVVFNTAMVGYPESLTDPSYSGQILTVTYPLVGNYGVPEDNIINGLSQFYESEKIQVSGLIISEYSHEYSHWNARKSLGDWLKEHKVPGIYGVDTRALTKLIREKGSMMGKIEVKGERQRAKDSDPLPFVDPNLENLVAKVSCKEVLRYGNGSKTIVLVDCGVKHNIVRCLLKRDVTIIRVPWDYDFNTLEYDGLFISNGPGNPDHCGITVEHIRKAMETGKPIFGICMGNQLLAKAGGASTFKLKYGHRSHNQPVRMAGSNRCFITSQNHGYAVDTDTLGEDWEVLFTNMNDGTNEGVRHKTAPWFSAQFHPEAASGPTDTEFLFDLFIDNITPSTGPLRSRGSADFQSLTPFEAPVSPSEGEGRGEVVLLLGSGALKIGEAGEFDYSGSQALKALKEEGITTVLINPNIATVQTSEGVADKIYFLPVTPFFVEKVIEKERPNGILLSFGGQTALNCGVALYKSGVFEKYNVQVLGTPVQSIIDTEDRELFVKKLDQIDVKSIKSVAVESIDDALNAAGQLGYPVIVRAAYALGGMGSGFCNNPGELRVLAEKAFNYSGQLLIEKSLKGWKEIEYEVVRDKYDNCITVCNMENFDPLGIHTGESIVVAPSQTLTNREYHKLRELSIRIIRHIGIVGECNVQYAFDPASEDYRVIEVNARLSRSSALASKATGYPLAFIAAKLSLGYGLQDLKNSVTKTTTAFFEPALDYIVCKIPRWDLGKFQGVSQEIGSSMKSVGEVMSIGRSFEEVIQKGLRMIAQGMHGFVANKDLETDDIDRALAEPTDKRIFIIAQALEAGYSIEHIHELTKIDLWFLQKLQLIYQCSKEIKTYNSVEELPEDLLRTAKQKGFSDFQITKLLYENSDIATDKKALLRAVRKKAGIVPVVKQIDTLAAEYPAQTNYLYLTYNGSENDVHYLGDKRSVIVLGSGAYRIGSSVEFDWCSVNALETIRRRGWRGVMINYNPETVSTDYDMCDRLYFDELTYERVMDIIELENPHGVVLSTGGQIPNNLALSLDRAGVPILGTSASNIDNAEDRHKFSSMLDRLGIDQPRWKELTSLADIDQFVEEVGFPVLVRPSYVLSGAAMNVCSNPTELSRFLKLAANVSQKHPVVVSEFIQNAKEIEIDAVADHGEIISYAISEHIEFAGVHSGDATIQFPPQRLYVETVRKIKRIAREIAAALQITGPFNIQFLAKDNDIKVIECNLRASRSFPFVSKVLKLNFIELATRIMLGETVERPGKNEFDLDYVGIKASQFSFARLQKADPVLGVDMASTGEVGCIGDDYYEAVLKSMLSVGMQIPKKNVLISSGTLRSKVDTLNACRLLCEKGYTIYATEGTHKFLSDNHIPSILVYQPSENGNPNALDMIRNKQIDLVVNIPKNLTEGELSNGYKIRRDAIDFNVPLFTNARLASAFIQAFCYLDMDTIPIKSWDEYK
ncbi:MAG: carbamoyl-phosphate synthase (glutamine-hydrolyzing) large subunit [Dysgonamonadaceae bacterium]|jgi:carbamoyl-phosphate synthase large subunit|nr:carbamoyl-phosphate synthase (glutamine-hydrolyzing) large subunit [Dysgonamonadaceae bacterium]